MNAIQSERGRILRSATAEDSRSFQAVLSTGAVARDNHAIDPRGWILPAGAEAPLLDSHRDAAGIASVLGRARYIRRPDDGGKTLDGRPALVGTLVLAPGAANPAAESACQLIRGGFIDRVSVSFFPRTWEPARNRGPGAMDISEAELLEVSLVAIPSDVDAVILGRALSRSARGSALTRADRAALAHAYAARAARDDALAREHETRADRIQRARELTGGDAIEIDAMRRLLLVDQP
jgi:HK97 family phage prohead protease